MKGLKPHGPMMPEWGGYSAMAQPLLMPVQALPEERLLLDGSTLQAGYID